MGRWISYLILLAFISPACLQSLEWTKEDINKKLREVFPNATSIRIFDGNEAGPDTFRMPAPIYKALVNEKDIGSYSFIFYFYNSPGIDTVLLAKILRATIVTDITAGLGTRKPQYVFGMPQYATMTNMMVVYAVSVTLPETYDVSSAEKTIRKIFGLPQPKLKDARIIDQEKDH
jgi:hypothetical protein